MKEREGVIKWGEREEEGRGRGLTLSRSCSSKST